jgi:GNAT superfamily N-acetyltransferase
MRKLSFRDTRTIESSTLRQLFREEQWNDFFDLDEVELHLRTALYIVSAWLGDELIGYGRLQGDGRIWIEISDVLVKSEHRGKGIGTEIVRRLVERCRELDPYYIQVSAIKGETEHLYEKFGFSHLDYNTPMELRTEKLLRKGEQLRGNQGIQDSRGG